jgi:hypothetical protein
MAERRYHLRRLHGPGSIDRECEVRLNGAVIGRVHRFRIEDMRALRGQVRS